MATVLEPGPGLAEVLATQSFDEQAVGYPQLERYAHALAKLCRELSYPLVWPVGPAAERLAGAAVIVSRGRIRPRGWTVSLRGERVLLVTVSSITPLPLFAAADQATLLGVAEVLACGVCVQGLEHALWPRPVAYFPLACDQLLSQATA